MAVATSNSVFESSDDYSDEDCWAFAQEQLDTLEFLYGDIESQVRASFILLQMTNYY